MSDRRGFLRQAAACVAAPLAAGVTGAGAWIDGAVSGQGAGGGVRLAGAAEPARPAAKRPKLAVVTTEWRYRSHAWHMAERFLVGYPRQGGWHRPPLDVVSAYVDQFPEGDLARGRSEEFKFPIYPSVAEALRCGGDRLAVDAVLIIGEHGRYPKSEYG